MQKLMIQSKKPDGTEAAMPVNIVRSWHHANGSELFLHATGLYGYKDGKPVESEAKLREMVDPGHLPSALAWWANTGKDLAARAYAGNETPTPPVKSPSLYWRYPAGKRPRNMAALAPLGHLEAGFPVKPDWWGEADNLTLAGETYEKVPDGTDPLPVPAPAEAPSPAEF